MKTKRRSDTDPLQKSSPVDAGLQSAPAIPRLLRLPQVLDLYPVGRSTWYEGVRKGVYPRPVRISRRSVGWPAERIHELIKGRTDA